MKPNDGTIYFEEFDKKIKDVWIGLEHVTIVFDDLDQISFESHHEDDCCEHVYADFSVVKYQKDELMNKQINSITIKGVDEIGILLIFGDKYIGTTKILVPCYNSQNGYYSDGLELKITTMNDVKHIDITQYKEDQIYD